MYLDSRARHRANAQDLEGGARGGLLALFDGVALARANFPAVDRDGAGEVWAVGWSVFGANSVDRAQALGLQRLLKQGFPVPKLVGIYLGGVKDLVYRPVHEIFVYKVRRADDRLDRVGDDGVVYHRALYVRF